MEKARCPKCNKEIDMLYCREAIWEFSRVTLESWGKKKINYDLDFDLSDTQEIYSNDLRKGVKGLVFGCPECEEVLTDNREEAIEILKPKDEIVIMAEKTKEYLNGVKNETN